MHPTWLAMVAGEREVQIARRAAQGSRSDAAAFLDLGAAPPTRSPRSGPVPLLASAKTAGALLLPRPTAAAREGTAARVVCCA